MENFDFQAFFSKIIDSIVGFCLSFGTKLVLAAIVLVIGIILIKVLTKHLRNKKIGKHGDPTVSRFVANAISAVLYVILAVTVIAIMGVPMASVVAVIATCGVAVGLALQGSLSNLAGGIMILIFRPFKLGDFVEAAGETGTVTDVGIFYTTLKTGDNKCVTVPNGSMMNTNVVNYSVHDTRRVDFTFSVAYGTDVEKVRTILLEEAEKHEKALKDPAPFCRLAKQNSSSLDFVLRVWANSGDYWTVNFDILEAVNNRFKEEGIEIPFPQMDVHVKQK